MSIRRRSNTCSTSTWTSVKGFPPTVPAVRDSIILIAKPGPGVSPEQAARTILKSFLPKAFRRPVTESDIAPYMDLFKAAQRGQSFESAIFFVLRGALVSPLFLFHIEPPNNGAEARPLDQYALASRLSYFLWSTMPDELLFVLEAEGKL